MALKPPATAYVHGQPQSCQPSEGYQANESIWSRCPLSGLGLAALLSFDKPRNVQCHCLEGRATARAGAEMLENTGYVFSASALVPRSCIEWMQPTTCRRPSNDVRLLASKVLHLM